MSTKREAPNSDDEPLNKRCKVDVRTVNDNFTICCTPAPLKCLAALKISLSIWCHFKIRSCKNQGYATLHYDVRYADESFIHVPPYFSATDYENDNQPVMKPIRDSVETLSLPTQMAELVLNQCKIRERELRLWAFRHEGLISLELFSSEDIFWKTDGLIDYVKTVQNVLSSSKPDILQKFELMSEYCLKDDIESLPKLILNLRDVNRWKVDEKPLQVYWRCYLKGNLSMIEVWLSFSEYASLDASMLLYGDASTNRSSFEYFYNRVRDADRVPVSISLIRRPDFRFKRVLLSRLNKSEHDQVLKECAYLIIMDLGRFVEYENYVSNILINYKEHLSESTLIRIIRSLFLCPKVDQDLQDHVDRLLFDIWDTSTDTMKEHLWKRGVLFLKTGIRRFEFLKKIFSEASAQMRTELVKSTSFLIFCSSLIETHQWYDCDSFIKLFFPSNDQILEFKANLLHTMEIETYCRKIFIDHGVERLDDLLSAFLCDKDALFEYKKDLLSSKVFLKDYCILEFKSHRTDKLTELIELIDYKFPDPQKAADFRIELMLERKVVKMMCQYINEGNFDRTRSMIDHLLARTEDIESVKAKLLSEYKNYIKMGKFLPLRKVEWNKFLPWCSDSAKEDLKKSLQVDDIFSKMLKKIVFANKLEDGEIESRLEELNYLLLWFFETKDRIDEYKLEKAYSYYVTLMKKINTKKLRGLCLRELVVGWFFNGNQLLIDDFYE